MTRLLLLALLASLSITAFLPGESPRKMPLDLPSGGRGQPADDEDSPEVITFFGHSYEGDDFYFLLDKSGSMIGEKLQLLKAELTSTLNSLSTDSRFGMVAFSDNVIRFANVPLPASAARKAQAVTWVQSLVAAGATHMLAGAVEILSIAHHSAAPSRVVIAVGDGLPNEPDAPETLTGILIANWESLPFNTILFGDDPPAVDFMQELAESTGGTFQSNPE